MFDQKTWEFINTFAPWLSAIGSIAAVITALYLAQKSGAIKLKIKARIMLLVTEGDTSGEHPKYLDVTVTNIRRREATVNAIAWETGLFKKNLAYWKVPRNELSSGIPVTLKDGESAQYMMPMTQFDSLLGDLGKNYLTGWMAPIKAHFIRAIATTSTGDYFKRKVDKSLRDRFLKLARRAAKNSS